jgi:hypothetical protein
MENIETRARNNLGVPVRLTFPISGASPEDSRILITVGPPGVKLSGFYGVCIDTDLQPNEDWEEIGVLNIKTKCYASLQGLKKPS